MAPPGVNTCFDQLDTVTFTSYYAPVSTTLKTMSLSSASLSPPATIFFPEISTCVAHSDHDYVMKPQIKSMEYVDSNHMCHLPADYDNSGYSDAMLSSCAIDSEKGLGECTDTDFLKDLDDLNFTFDDLNPCCEVAMEDSFQEFIDSALEHSYSTCLHDEFRDNDVPARGQDAVIFNKEQFLTILELRPTQDKNVNDKVWSQTSTSIGTGSSSNSIICFSDRTVSEITDHTSRIVYTKDAASNDRVPTRQCSCVSFESESKAVYSVAHPTNQENVRTCSSTLALNNKSDCTDCSQSGLTSAVRMSPLIVDTASCGISYPFQSSSKDCIDVVMVEDTVQRRDKDTADIMTWLNESQQEFQQQYGDNNVITAEHNDEPSAGTDMPIQSMKIPSTLDLESFVDLEDFEVDTPASEAYTVTDHTYQKHADQSKHVSNSSCISQLKLSVFTERMGDGNTFMQGCFSHTYPESSVSETLSPNSSDFSHNVFSPSLSIPDSTPSPFSPQHLRSMDFSFSSNYEEAMYDTAVKSPLALLNLFSDENATSLLHADSTVPSIRFM